MNPMSLYLNLALSRTVMTRVAVHKNYQADLINVLTDLKTGF
jgi:hypothetical protein